MAGSEDEGRERKLSEAMAKATAGAMAKATVPIA
jgi:hypothetical protein